MSDEVTVPAPTMTQFEAGTFSVTAESIVHTLVGAQFGDLEFDVGKSVRWTQWFSDDMFITDVNLGTQRYWVVNWEQTYPNAYHRITGTNFFYDTAKFRKEQFDAAATTYGRFMEDNDWVMFVDAHEGLCIDTRNPQPNDVAIEMFRSYIYREITRATNAGKDRVVLPFYAFLRHANTITCHYPAPAFADNSLGYTTATASMGTPYYLPMQGLTRLIKVSALRNPNFNWKSIDVPSAADTGLNTAIVSYGYAHWNILDIIPPATAVEPLTEANDDGWRMRNLLSAVRPVPTLPIGAYQPPSADPVGLAGPWAAADALTPDPIEPQPVTPAPALAGLLVGLYDSVFRINYRDGVWYEGGELGNIPLQWNDATQTWVARNMTPQEWHDTQGVGGSDLMLVVINVEDVLAPGRDLRTIASYRGASVFYDAMATQYQLIALTMATEEVARWWLKRERMPKWAQVYAADAINLGWDAADFQEWQYGTVRGLLAEGWEVAFYVDVANGNLTERMHNMGVTTMTMRRNTTIPGWRNPETSAPRAWDTLVVDS